MPRAARLLVLVLLAAAVSTARGEELRSPINGRTLLLDQAPSSYSFLLIGHPYGEHNRSVFPAASLLANVERINGQGPSFVALLGDLVRNVREPELKAFRESFSDKIAAPVFNAIGNHDAGGRDLYQKYFGSKAYFSFRFGSELFVFLDSEENGGRLRGSQLAFALGEIERARGAPEIRNLFIFSHRLLWAINHPPLRRILPFVNGPDLHKSDNDAFFKEIFPKLKGLGNKPVFLASGDIGAAWSLPLFYEKDPNGPIHYLATGLGDTEKDAVIRVTVRDGGAAVELSGVSLTGVGAADAEGTIGLAGVGIRTWMRHFEELKKKEGGGGLDRRPRGGHP